MCYNVFIGNDTGSTLLLLSGTSTACEVLAPKKCVWGFRICLYASAEDCLSVGILIIEFSSHLQLYPRLSESIMYSDRQVLDIVYFLVLFGI